MTKRKVDPEKVTGALAERQTSKGRRVKLTKAEREAFIRQQRAEHAAALFLDLDEARTWAEIASEMELSPHQLRDLSKTEEFDEAYNRLFAELGHDPRYKAAQGALADMLPLALSELRGLLTNTRTAAGTKLRAIEKVMALNGLENVQPAQSDRQELVTFLVENKIDLSDVKIVLPSEYAEVEGEVVEAEYKDSTPPLLRNENTTSDQQEGDTSQAPGDDPPVEEYEEHTLSISETDPEHHPAEELFHHQDTEAQTAD